MVLYMEPLGDKPGRSSGHGQGSGDFARTFRFWLLGLEFRIWVYSLGFWVYVSGFRILGFWVQSVGSGFEVGLGSRAPAVGFRGSGFGVDSGRVSHVGSRKLFALQG